MTTSIRPPATGDRETGGQGDGENSEPRTQNPEPGLSTQHSALSTPKKAHRRPPRPVILLAIVLLGAAAWWFYTGVTTAPPRGIMASGTIESEEVSIASEVAGRVTQLLADEGDRVKAGDVLVKLDDSLLSLQLKMVPMSDRPPLQIQLDKMTLRSPLDGLVSRRSIRAGEVATPGATLMVVTRVDQVELTVYVPEKEIGRVRVGQKVEVQVDSFPKEIFPGEVTFIATKAEFTPRNVQTQKDRLNLVFAVKVQIPNSDLRLKPGMPADATIPY